jgi:hypothetical protein
MKGLLVLAMLLAAPAARADDGWAAWQPMLGTFVADGATMTLEPALDGKVLVRKNQAGKHSDLMVISVDGGKTRADYWDNEGHVIRYDVTVAGTQAVFLAAPRADAPGFRFTVDFADRDNLGMTFEVAPPGGAFKSYLSGKMRRKAGGEARREARVGAELLESARTNRPPSFMCTLSYGDSRSSVRASEGRLTMWLTRWAQPTRTRHATPARFRPSRRCRSLPRGAATYRDRGFNATRQGAVCALTNASRWVISLRKESRSECPPSSPRSASTAARASRNARTRPSARARTSM